MMNHIYGLSASLLALCAILTLAQFVTADGSLQSNMLRMKITPELIKETRDVGLLSFDLHGNKVKPGDLVPASRFNDINMGKITWDGNNFDARHTLILLDLDKKPGSNGTNSIYNQFTSLNIPGNVISLGQNIVAFEPPTVPCQPGTRHRMLMLAYHQAQNIDISDVAYISASTGQSSKRESFKLQDFVNRHRLELIAANVFYTTGETNGVCSGSVSLHSISVHSVSTSILVAMVIAVTGAFGFTRRRSVVN